MADHIQIDDVTPRIAYTAASGQTVFQIPFAFFADADLNVYVNDVLQTLDTDYTVAGEGASELSTRKVTFASGLTLDDAVVIVRDIPVERTTDFPASGPLSPDTLNTQFDKIFAIQQQLEDLIARTFRLADSDTSENVDLPVASERAGQFLAFDADGDPIVAASVDSGIAVSAFMQTVLDDPDATTARATLGIASVDNITNIFNWTNFR